MSLWDHLNKSPKERTRRQDIVDIGGVFEIAAAREETFHMAGVSLCVAGHFDSENRLIETLEGESCACPVSNIDVALRERKFVRPILRKIYCFLCSVQSHGIAQENVDGVSDRDHGSYSFRF